MKNILEQFLNEIEVPYTRLFAEKLYNEHPHRNNMYGLKRMLDVYGVKTLGVYMENKALSELNYPCILHTHGDFVIGLDCDADTVKFLQHGKETTLAHDVFLQSWTGNALVVQETTDAVEPDYKRHQRDGVISMAKRYSIPVMLMLAVVVGIVSHLGDTGIFDITRIALSAAGILVCVMLMEKQLFGESRYGDKVCSLFHRTDCNSVLDGPMAKVFGISWSEVGLGYFTAHILLLALMPAASDFVAAINWIAMLYGIWSIYYQWRVARSWCVLCMIVQAIIWTMGIVAAAQHLTAPFMFDLVSSLLSCIVFAISIVAVHQYASARETEKERVRAVQRYRALKANGDVARALIEKGEYHETTLSDSSIIFGNPNAKMRVTILSNPHCNPCAKMHMEVDELLNSCGDKICVQYIFSSFNEQLEDSCRYLISCFYNNDQQVARKLYSNWYGGDKDHYKIITKNENYDIMVEDELKTHHNWRKRTGLTTTPTVLVNNYELPKEYKLNELKMIIDLVIE